ncbi:photosystem II biogenesis protein Psp29, partial [Fischerella thermalis]|uniref:photosystem II biogenesis protein Psp29 n=2 Tax=Fischerella thermalis TaxID=372787 RepID=UPI002351F446
AIGYLIFTLRISSYRSNLDKMAQALVVMADMLSADRKKREQRSQQSSTTVTPPTASE